MNQRDKFLKALAFAVGYEEEPDGTTIYGKSYDKRHGTNVFANAAWCMVYVAETARSCGIPDTIIPDTASCPTFLRWGEERGLRIGDVPAQPGDLVLYEWNPYAGDGVDHVGVVFEVHGDTPDTQRLRMYEGNWGNKVAITEYDYRDARVSAILRPKYDLTDIPEEPEEHEEIQVTVTLRQLQEGDAGIDVAVVQQLLAMHGYDPTYIDSIFGEKTAAAVKKFQWGMNLEADGIVGEKTWTALLGG